MQRNRIALALLIVSAAGASCGGRSSRTSLRRIEGPPRVELFAERKFGSHDLGRDNVPTDELYLEITPVSDTAPLRGEGVSCSWEERAQVELALDEAKGIVAYRCRPGQAWTALHVGRRGYHRDCYAKLGSDAAPDFANAAGLLESFAGASRCVFSDTVLPLSDWDAQRRLYYLALDVAAIASSREATAERMVSTLDGWLAQTEPRRSWGKHVQTLLKELSWDKNNQPLWPEEMRGLMERAAIARLAHETDWRAAEALLELAPIDDATLPAAVASALPELSRRGARSPRPVDQMFAVALAHDQPDLGAMACRTIAAGSSSAIAAWALAKTKARCPALADALARRPHALEACSSPGACSAAQLAQTLDPLATKLVSPAWYVARIPQDPAMPEPAWDVEDHYDEALVAALCAQPRPLPMALDQLGSCR